MTATTSRGVKCGNCGNYHPSASAVKVCYGHALIGEDEDTGTEVHVGREGIYGRGRWRTNNAADLSGQQTMHTDDRNAALRNADRWRTNNAAKSPFARPQATEKQMAYLMKLLNERQYEDTPHLIAVRNGTEGVDKAHASELIDILKDKPRKLDRHDLDSEVEAGHYAIPSLTGNNDLDFFRIDKGTGQWEGRTFVKRIVGGRPDMPLRAGEAKKVLTALAELGESGREEARQRYGREVGRCYRCNRHLTDETSRALGIGPDCRERM